MGRIPGSSRSALLSINGPELGFGAAIKVLLWTSCRALEALGRRRAPALDRNNLGIILDGRWILTWSRNRQCVEGVRLALLGLHMQGYYFRTSSP